MIVGAHAGSTAQSVDTQRLLNCMSMSAPSGVPLKLAIAATIAVLAPAGSNGPGILADSYHFQF